jgi:ubiquinone biosynthesis UbiH/UbiF/VisC/COQ6 family hydroxylase
MTTTSTSTRIRSDVCIVGNGAIAKTAALGLSQAGHSVTLLCPPTPPAHDKPAGEQPWDVRVYAVNHTAHSLLTQLRVWGALDMARVAPVESMRVHGDGANSGSIGFDAFGAHVGSLAWIVEDCNLNQALDAALKFAPNVRLSSGRACTLDTAGDTATVTLADGTVIESDLLLGADGADSWVRNKCDIGYDYRAYHQRAIVTNFSCAKPHHGIAHQWFTCADGIVALLPLPGDRVSLVWSAPTTLADTITSETLSELAVRLSEYADAELGPLRPLTPEDVKAFPLRLIRPHSLVAPRVALIGDAAHAIHPLAGHGMNLGFGDIQDLLKVLAEREPQRGIGDERVLARYARARKEDVFLMQFATDSLERLFASNLEPVRAVRNFGLNLLDKFPSLKRRMVAQALGKASTHV